MIIIIGAGPAGSTLALYLAKRGVNSTIIEKETFPRFRIGESLTGETGTMLRELGLEDIMKDHDFPIKCGTYVYGRGGNNTFHIPVMARDDHSNLVNAETWQVNRSLFDKILLDTAIKTGYVKYYHGSANAIEYRNDLIDSIKIKNTDGTINNMRPELLIDATGQSTFLSSSGILPNKKIGKYNKQVAIFSHLKKVGGRIGKNCSDTLIFYRKKYHWAWYIPIDIDTVSIGVVIPREYYLAKKRGGIEPLYWSELHTLNPELTWRVKDAEIISNVKVCTNYSYNLSERFGKNYLAIGDAKKFIDPIFSYGVHIAMHDAREAANAIINFIESKEQDASQYFSTFDKFSEKGQKNVEKLIDGFWSNPTLFSFIVQDKRYRDSFIDTFAGRIYDSLSYPALNYLWQMLSISKELS